MQIEAFVNEMESAKNKGRRSRWTNGQIWIGYKINILRKADK